MSLPQVSKNATSKWGRFPFNQRAVTATTGTVIPAVNSGVLYTGNGSVINMTMAGMHDGVSFAFDARGGTINVTLPPGEQTSVGDASVSIGTVASLTRAGGVWTYAGN